MLFAILFLCITGFQMIDGFGLYFLMVQIAAVILCLVALAVILKINISLYRKRHSSLMQLSERYHLDENIRAGKYYIPVAINDFICKVHSV
ncbi:hypothetical protein GCK32_020915 [Trichostrongylus colubriformis]|uniref:Uncharacterized protein n=1 Tax=Trichostrongylus colubriformis TaxID=6319 RepID=A0AAN8ITI4_TRICO